MGYTASYNLNGRTIYITDQPLAPFVFPGISLQLPKTLLVDLDNDDMVRLETALHKKYSKFRTNGEWFILPPEEIEELKRCAYHSQEQEKPLEKELAT